MRTASFTLLLLLSSAASAAAQSAWSATLGTGYTNARGNDPRWDDGRVFHVRSAVWRRLGGSLDLGLEGGAYLFGTERSTFNCGGGPACGDRSFTWIEERKSWAWTADLALRWRLGAGTVRPHATLGLGVAQRRDPVRFTEYENGLLREERHGTSSSTHPAAALALGLEIGPPGSRVAVTTSLRGDFLYDAYDGTPSISRLVSVGVGVVIR